MKVLKLYYDNNRIQQGESYFAKIFVNQIVSIEAITTLKNYGNTMEGFCVFINTTKGSEKIIVGIGTCVEEIGQKNKEVARKIISDFNKYIDELIDLSKDEIIIRQDDMDKKYREIVDRVLKSDNGA